jgi:hypothetical protein
MAFYVLLHEEKKLQIVFTLKTPIGYVLSLNSRVHKDGELKGLKSHDYHIMTQDLLPLCMQQIMAKGCKLAIICLFHVFKKLCVKIFDLTMMGELKKDVALTLVLLEQEFPLSFFNIMTHLLVHFVEHLEICGPMHTLWMYPIEHCMKTSKGYIRNKVRMERSMAKGYALH